MEDGTAKAKADERPAGDGPDASQTKGSPEGTSKKKRKTVIEDLKRDIEQQKQIAQNNYEKFLRAYAELENYKKRVEKDRAENLKYANEQLLRDLLPFIDNLERAVDHASAESNTNPGALVQGVELTLKELIRVLEKHGLKPVEAVGAHFDPNLHEAMMQVESTELEPQTVVQEFQKGYLLRDRLLRPARVSVAVRPASTESEEAKIENEEGRSSPPDQEGVE